MSGRSAATARGPCSPYKDGGAAYVGVATPDGRRRREYGTSKDREECHDKWIALQAKTKANTISTSTGTVADYGRYWLEEILKPDLSPGMYVNHSGRFRTRIVPGLGGKQYTTLRVRDVQVRLSEAAATCQCRFQGKDAERAPEKQRCRAMGKRCKDLHSIESLRCLRRTVRAMLGAPSPRRRSTRTRRLR